MVFDTDDSGSELKILKLGFRNIEFDQRSNIRDSRTSFSDNRNHRKKKQNCKFLFDNVADIVGCSLDLYDYQANTVLV